MSYTELFAALHLKQGQAVHVTTATVTNQPYDDDEEVVEKDASHPAMTVPLDALAALALYCVEDVSSLPEKLCEKLVKSEPARILMPSWTEKLQDRRVWIAAGPKRQVETSEGTLPITAGFHWDHMENIHIVLAGSKEVVLVPPLDALALRATRHCPQAQWHLECNENRALQLHLRSMHSVESTSDYGV
eukprot:3713381-Amphidinium_carterae.1